MKFTSEVKVGIIITVAIAIFVWMVLVLGKVKFKDEGYEIKVIFPKIVGLREKDAVMLSGVRVGSVEKIYLEPSNKVAVTLRIKPQIKIREDALFIITTESLLGIDKFVAIIPQSDNARILKNGDKVEGQPPIEVREIMFGIKDTLDKTRKLSDSIDAILQDRDFVSSIKETVSNISTASEQIAQFTSTLNNIMIENKGEINTIVKDIKDIVKNIEATSVKIKKIAEGEDISDIIHSLRESANRLESITKKIDTDVMDKETISNIKGTLKNINQITNEITKSSENIKNIKTKPSVEFSGAKDENSKYKYQTNTEIEIRSIKSPEFYLVGIQNIGEKNKLNLQVGKEVKNNITLRGGIRESKVGAGLDFSKNDLTGKIDFLNPNEPRWDTSLYYKFKEGLYIFWKQEDVEKRKDNFFGIKFEK